MLQEEQDKAQEKADAAGAVGGFESITAAFNRIATAASGRGGEDVAQKQLNEQQRTREAAEKWLEKGSDIVEAVRDLGSSLEDRPGSTVAVFGG